jgi:hypothetical protein
VDINHTWPERLSRTVMSVHGYLRGVGWAEEASIVAVSPTMTILPTAFTITGLD